MKVLLLQHVKNLGKKGDIVDVSDGYAVNSLFPQKKAQQATAKVVNDFKTKKAAQLSQQEKEREQTMKIMAAIKGNKVILKEKMNPKGTLYHALGTKEIIRAVFDQYTLRLRKDLFKEDYSFKEQGSYNITLSAYGTEVDFTLQIVEG